jgi:hypothetical protein
MRSKRPMSLGMAVLLPVIAAACAVASNTPTEDAPSCATGTSRACVGAENCNGIQTCLTSGNWDGCRCDSVSEEIEAGSGTATESGSGTLKSPPPPDGGPGPGKDLGETPDSTRPDESEAGTDAHAMDVDVDAGDLACGKEPDQSDCATCCENDHPAGNAYLYNALVVCACASGGPCQTPCASEACVGIPAAGGDACDTCLTAALSSTGACDGSVLASCDTNADCLADVICQDNECAGLPSP